MYETLNDIQSDLPRNNMNTDQQLIFDAMKVVAGESMQLASVDMLRALLEERTDLIDALNMAHDGLADAVGMDEEWRKAAYLTVKEHVHGFEWLKRADPNWAEKVLGIHGFMEKMRKVV